MQTGTHQQKACPLVRRIQNGRTELLLFLHPQAGIQLVKGTIEEHDDSVVGAALRELAEESGITNVLSTQYLGLWQSGHKQQVWHFVLCECGWLPECWSFQTMDDYGHQFDFFWHDIENTFHSDCHSVFMRAIEEARRLI